MSSVSISHTVSSDKEPIIMLSIVLGFLSILISLKGSLFLGLLSPIVSLFLHIPLFSRSSLDWLGNLHLSSSLMKKKECFMLFTISKNREFLEGNIFLTCFTSLKNSENVVLLGQHSKILERWFTLKTDASIVEYFNKQKEI